MYIYIYKYIYIYIYIYILHTHQAVEAFKPDSYHVIICKSPINKTINKNRFLFIEGFK